MEKKFRFKTTLKCSGCVSKVTPFLNSLRDVTEWSVDLQHPDKVLTVKKAFENAGYKVEEFR